MFAKRKFSDEEGVSKIKDTSLRSIKAILIALNVSYKSGTNYAKINELVDRFNLDTSHWLGTGYLTEQVVNKRYKTAEEIIASWNVIPSSTLKKKLFREKIKQEVCECCGISEWCGQKAPLELHHKDGNRLNNRLENLQILCANCHAQTKNYSGKNKRTSSLHNSSA